MNAYACSILISCCVSHDHARLMFRQRRNWSNKSVVRCLARKDPN